MIYYYLHPEPLHHDKPMKILLLVDGSTFTEHMLEYVAKHANLLGSTSEFTAFTVVAPIPAHAASFLARDVLEDYYHSEAEKVLAGVREFAGCHGLSIATQYAVGHVAPTIAAQVKAHPPDVIVMGSHGHSALTNVVLGSVATGVLAHCDTPVLIVR